MDSRKTSTLYDRMYNLSLEYLKTEWDATKEMDTEAKSICNALLGYWKKGKPETELVCKDDDTKRLSFQYKDYACYVDVYSNDNVTFWVGECPVQTDVEGAWDMVLEGYLQRYLKDKLYKSVEEHFRYYNKPILKLEYTKLDRLKKECLYGILEWYKKYNPETTSFKNWEGNFCLQFDLMSPNESFRISADGHCCVFAGNSGWTWEDENMVLDYFYLKLQ